MHGKSEIQVRAEKVFIKLTTCVQIFVFTARRLNEINNINFSWVIFLSVQWMKIIKKCEWHAARHFRGKLMIKMSFFRVINLCTAEQQNLLFWVEVFYWGKHVCCNHTESLLTVALVAWSIKPVKFSWIALLHLSPFIGNVWNFFSPLESFKDFHFQSTSNDDAFSINLSFEVNFFSCHLQDLFLFVCFLSDAHKWVIKANWP